MSDQTKEQVVAPPLTEELWLDKVNEEAQEKATELSGLLNAVVEPFVFVIEPLKDAAVGFIKKPDAKQGLKLVRTIGNDYETGIELAARAQLIREYNGMIASDKRFMDVDGKYAPEDSELNLGFLLRIQKLVHIYSDQFKKK